MTKYVVEVKVWVKQVRLGYLGCASQGYEMTLEEAEALNVRLRDQGVSKDDIRIKEAR